jgi:hypothetical protein
MGVFCGFLLIPAVILLAFALAFGLVVATDLVGNPMQWLSRLFDSLCNRWGERHTR